MNKLIYEQALVIPVVGGESGVVGANVIDNLNSFSSTDALSANQGRVLDGKISDVANRVAPVLDESGKVIETKEQYLMRVSMSLRYVGMSVVLNDGFRYEFKGGIQDKDFVRMEVPTGEGGGGSSVDVVDSLSSSATDKALSANQGRVLDEKKLDTVNFQAHQNDRNNPHNVTLEQVGGAAKKHTHGFSDITGLQDSLDSKASVASLSEHTEARNNPHGVTAEQTGAALKEHTHIISDVNELQAELDLKLNKEIWDENFESKNNSLDAKKTIIVSGDVIVKGDTGTNTLDGVETYPIATGSSYLWELQDVNDLVKDAPDGSMLVKKDGEWVFVDKIVINCGTYNIV